MAVLRCQKITAVKAGPSLLVNLSLSRAPKLSSRERLSTAHVKDASRPCPAYVAMIGTFCKHVQQKTEFNSEQEGG